MEATGAYATPTASVARNMVKGREIGEWAHIEAEKVMAFLNAGFASAPLDFTLLVVVICHRVCQYCGGFNRGC